MTTISKISTRSRNADVNETAESLIAAFEKHDFSADVYATASFGRLKQENASLTTGIKVGGVYSRQALCDEARDNAGRGLFLCVNAAELLPDESISSAAFAIGRILDKYTTGIFKESYDEETAHIRSLLEELTAGSEEVKRVPQLELHVQHLARRQGEFDAAKEEFVNAQVDEKSIPSASKVRAEIVNLLNKNIIPYLNTMARVNPDVYGGFATICAELINRNNQRVKRRLAGGEDGVM